MTLGCFLLILSIKKIDGTQKILTRLINLKPAEMSHFLS